jgi:hypothetical protein
MRDQSKLLDAALSFVALIEITLMKEERGRGRGEKIEKKSVVRACMFVTVTLVRRTHTLKE